MTIKRMQQRHDTVANWAAANPVLFVGELGYETDTGKFKFGDGITAWNSLSYDAASSVAWSDVSARPAPLIAGGNAPNGYPILDGGGKIGANQLTITAMEYKGVWNATTNSPTLADGTGNQGDLYRVSPGGTQNLGSGSIVFVASDYVIYNGTTWEKSDTTDAVASVAGLVGPITGSALKTALSLDLVDNTPDSGKPVSAAQQTALDGKKPIEAGTFPWPPGLVGLWDFQHDTAGGTTLTSRVGSQTTALTARGAKTVVKDAGDPGPFGPSLVLDGATVFALRGTLGALDPSTIGDQVTVVAWIKDSANNHDDGGSGLSFRAGSHDDVTPARQYGLYFDGSAFIWSHGHLTPHIGAQDGPSPGYPYNHDYAASARKLFTGIGQNQWHMEVMTFDGAQIIAYVDGLTDSYLAVPEPPPSVLSLSDGAYTPQTVDRNPYTLRRGLNRSQTAKVFSIGGTCGAADTGQSFTTGKLGGVAVFNRALTATEIMQIRLGTLLSGEAITMFSFEVAATGNKALKRIGWTAKADTNIDISTLTSVGSEYAITRPISGTKAYLTKTSAFIGAVWGTVTGLNSSQIRRLRFKMLSAATTSAAQRLLVKVAGQWWASNTTYAVTGAHAGDTDWSGAETKTHTVDWSAGQWKAVTMLDTPTASLFTNLAQNPSLSVNATNWFKSSAAANATAARVASGGGFVYRFTWTGTDTAAGAGGGLNNPAITGITPGVMHSASMVAKSSKAQLLHLEINWNDSSGAFISTTGGGCISVLANTDTTLVATGIAPVGAARMTLKVSPPSSGGTNWVNGDTMDLSNAIAVAGSALPAFFSGDTALASWTGTAGASTSTLTTTGAGAYQNLALNPSLSVNATNWFKSSSVANATATGRTAAGGGFVYRLMWTGTDVNGSGGLTLGGLGFGGINPIVAGNMYASSMLVTPSRNAKLFISLQWINAGGGTISTTDGGTVVVAAGVPTTLTVAGLAPALATGVTVKVTGVEFSWLSGDTFDMTNLLVVNGNILPAYFDGDTASGGWSGIAGASTSNITGVTLGTLSLDSSTNATFIDNALITAVGFLSSGGDGSAVRITDLELLPN